MDIVSYHRPARSVHHHMYTHTLSLVVYVMVCMLVYPQYIPSVVLVV